MFESPKIMIFEVSGVHMGRYGLILCANESYTNNLAFGINFDEQKAPAGTPKGDPAVSYTHLTLPTIA